MSENRKFLLLFLIILIIFLSEKIYKKIFSHETERKSHYEIILEKNSYGEKDRPIDINRGTVDQLLKKGINLKIAEEIDNYREITGGFEKLEDLKRIKGIGEKTYVKLSLKLSISEKPDKNFLYINEADDKTLTYFGFTKKEIKDIRKYQKNNIKIHSNLNLREFLEEKRYYYFKDIVQYDRY